MHPRISTKTPDEDPYMFVIQKYIPHVGDRLRTIECSFKTWQDA